MGSSKGNESSPGIDSARNHVEDYNLRAPPIKPQISDPRLDIVPAGDKRLINLSKQKGKTDYDNSYDKVVRN